MTADQDPHDDLDVEALDAPDETRAETGRRAQYRVEIEDDADLFVRVRPRDGEPTTGRVIDVSAAGAGVGFDSDGAPTLQVGQEVDLVFGSKRFSTPVTIAARVQHRSEDVETGRGVRRYGFRFLEPQQLDAYLPPAMREFFNRRQLVRVQPAQGSPVHVGIEVGAAVLEARLLNLSINGAGISLEAAAESILASAPVLVISIQLPDARRPMALMARIRYRRLIGGRVHYGLEFDPASEHFRRKQKALTRYVVRRQMDFLRAAS